jgi:hypothetical protein
MFGLGNPELGVLMLALFVVFIMFGFPIAFTLMALGVFFGYWGDGRSDLFAARPALYSVMTNDVLISDPAVRVHGIHHRARQYPRSPVPLAAACRRPGAGLAGACHHRHLRHLRHRDRHRRRLRHADGPAGFPAMLRAGYDVKIAAGAVCAGAASAFSSRRASC